MQQPPPACLTAFAVKRLSRPAASLLYSWRKVLHNLKPQRIACAELDVLELRRFACRRWILIVLPTRMCSSLLHLYLKTQRSSGCAMPPCRASRALTR